MVRLNCPEEALSQPIIATTMASMISNTLTLIIGSYLARQLYHPTETCQCYVIRATCLICGIVRPAM